MRQKRSVYLLAAPRIAETTARTDSMRDVRKAASKNNTAKNQAVTDRCPPTHPCHASYSARHTENAAFTTLQRHALLKPPPVPIPCAAFAKQLPKTTLQRIKPVIDRYPQPASLLCIPLGAAYRKRVVYCLAAPHIAETTARTDSMRGVRKAASRNNAAKNKPVSNKPPTRRPRP